MVCPSAPVRTADERDSGKSPPTLKPPPVGRCKKPPIGGKKGNAHALHCSLWVSCRDRFSVMIPSYVLTSGPTAGPQPAPAIALGLLPPPVRAGPAIAAVHWRHASVRSAPNRSFRLTASRGARPGLGCSPRRDPAGAAGRVSGHGLSRQGPTGPAAARPGGGATSRVPSAALRRRTQPSCTDMVPRSIARRIPSSLPGSSFLTRLTTASGPVSMALGRRQRPMPAGSRPREPAYVMVNSTQSCTHFRASRDAACSALTAPELAIHRQSSACKRPARRATSPARSVLAGAKTGVLGKLGLATKRAHQRETGPGHLRVVPKGCGRLHCQRAQEEREQACVPRPPHCPE